ncbi:MAG TPA: NAD-dependent deacylase [bacterium]|nr:NAD-dependent deacylase [bacterium]
MTEVERAAAILNAARPAVVFTGAGISTESGLPDFRSAGGLWTGVDPMEVASLSAFRRHPEAFFEFYRTRLAHLAQARPNRAHVALAGMEARGLTGVIITQNVDGLHQAAGSAQVIELHGNLREAACPDCGWIGPIAVITDALAGGVEPACPVCTRTVKPNVVLFEELLPAGAYARAQAACRRARALLVVGSSLQVTPAAALPPMVREAGGSVVIINAEPTPYDADAAVVLRGQAGTLLPELAAAAGRLGRNERDRKTLRSHDR